MSRSARGGRAWLAPWRGRALALVDQVLSSASNVLAVVLVAHSLDAVAFGRFALAYAVVVAALGVSRSWFGTRLSLLPDRAAVHREASVVLGSLSIVAPVLAAVVFLTGAVLSGGGAPGLLLLVALAAPVVCAQDAMRFAAVASGRPWAAVVSDGVWTGCLLAALPFASRLGTISVMVVWLAAAGLGLAAAMLTLRVRPDLPGGWLGLRQRHRTGESMSFGALAGTAASLAVTGVVGAVLSPAAVGSLRGASTFIGPLNVMMAFVSLGMTPVLVRRSRSRDLRFCLAVAGTVLSVVCAWAAVVLLLPDAWGRAVLGDSWAGARSVLPWTLLEYAALGVASASTLGLKVRQEARMLVRQKAAVSVLVVVLGCGAAVLAHDVRAVSAGLAVAGLVSVTLGWRHLTESMRRSADGAVGQRVSERPPDQPLVSGTP